MITHRRIGTPTIFAVLVAATILTAAIYLPSGVETSIISPTFAQDENMTGNVTEGNMTGPETINGGRETPPPDGGMEATPPVITP